MKNSLKKFDSVKMIREIREAYYRMKTDPGFDKSELKKIKEKWTAILKRQSVHA